jgi:hypothetical protein
MELLPLLQIARPSPGSRIRQLWARGAKGQRSCTGCRRPAVQLRGAASSAAHWPDALIREIPGITAENGSAAGPALALGAQKEQR